MAGKTKSTLSSFNKPQTWVGVSLVVLLLLGAGLLFSNSIKNTPRNTKEVSSTFTVPTLSTVAKKQESAKLEQPKITRLANTTGDTVVHVNALKGDNFWRISQRVCGTKVYQDSIRRYNGYQNRVLKPGDLLAVYCSY